MPDNGIIVTPHLRRPPASCPPSCGTSRRRRGCTEEQVLRSPGTAGILGNLAKRNASISGAECGCQAEVGVACAMAAGGLAVLYGLNPGSGGVRRRNRPEHHLGLTCDPICGLVQVPCIERNAVAAMRP